MSGTVLAYFLIASSNKFLSLSISYQADKTVPHFERHLNRKNNIYCLFPRNKNRVASGSVNISSFLFSNAYFHFTKTDPVECNTFP